MQHLHKRIAVHATSNPFGGPEDVAAHNVASLEIVPFKMAPGDGIAPENLMLQAGPKKGTMHLQRLRKPSRQEHRKNEERFTASAEKIAQCLAQLGLPANPTKASLERAYKAAARKLHPDRVKGDPEKEATTIKFQQLHNNYKLLCSLYDKPKRSDEAAKGRFHLFFVKAKKDSGHWPKWRTPLTADSIRTALNEFAQLLPEHQNLKWTTETDGRSINICLGNLRKIKFSDAWNPFIKHDFMLINGLNPEVYNTMKSDLQRLWTRFLDTISNNSEYTPAIKERRTEKLRAKLKPTDAAPENAPIKRNEPLKVIEDNTPYFKGHKHSEKALEEALWLIEATAELVESESAPETNTKEKMARVYEHVRTELFGYNFPEIEEYNALGSMTELVNALQEVATQHAINQLSRYKTNPNGLHRIIEFCTTAETIVADTQQALYFAKLKTEAEQVLAKNKAKPKPHSQVPESAPAKREGKPSRVERDNAAILEGPVSPPPVTPPYNSLETAIAEQIPRRERVFLRMDKRISLISKQIETIKEVAPEAQRKLSEFCHQLKLIAANDKKTPTMRNLKDIKIIIHAMMALIESIFTDENKDLIALYQELSLLNHEINKTKKAIKSEPQPPTIEEVIGAFRLGMETAETWPGIREDLEAAETPQDQVVALRTQAHPTHVKSAESKGLPHKAKQAARQLADTMRKPRIEHNEGPLRYVMKKVLSHPRYGLTLQEAGERETDPIRMLRLMRERRTTEPLDETV